MSDLPLDQLVQGHHWDPLAILGVHPMAQGSSPTEPFDVFVDVKKWPQGLGRGCEKTGLHIWHRSSGRQSVRGRGQDGEWTLTRIIHERFCCKR